MNKSVRMIIQIIFLILFVVLVVAGKIQLWMGIFLASVLLSVFLGRLYCGYACPINTLMQSVAWLKNKLSIKSFSLPRFLKRPWIRFFLLCLFLAILAFTMTTGKKLPVLPALVVLGVGLSFFFPESLWHRYVCPYGTIFSITSAKARHSMKIDQNACVQCGVCECVCPAEAVNNEGQYIIKQGDCIVCSTCSDRCGRHAIQYTK